MIHLAFMPFYWSDFLGDTSHLNGAETGAYLLLLGNMWLRRGWVPDDDVEIANMCRIDVEEWRAIKPKLRPLLRHRKGRISQKRLLDEIRKAKLTNERNKKRYANFAPHNAKKSTAKTEQNQTDTPVRDVTATATATATATELPNGSSKRPPNGGSRAYARGKPPVGKEFRDWSDALRDLQSEGTSDDERHSTIEGSVNRPDRESAGNIVQLYAAAKNDEF